MIQISAAAQRHFRGLFDAQGFDTMGILVSATDAGTPSAKIRLAFCEPKDLIGNELVVACDGFKLYVDGGCANFFEEATIDYQEHPTGGELKIRAPRLKGEGLAGDASLVERVQHVLDGRVNPQLASHGGRAHLEGITPEGVVKLRFGGGCHGCGMVDVTMKHGVERTLKAHVPEITGVQDVTDHSSGENPYYAAASGG